ncbi:hypothetical protein EDC04DRAFT_2749651, partial [Pisolithus marmoratus]
IIVSIRKAARHTEVPTLTLSRNAATSLADFTKLDIVRGVLRARSRTNWVGSLVSIINVERVDGDDLFRVARSQCKPRNCTSQSRAGLPYSEDPQSRLYYSNASTLPFSLWHPAYNLSPSVSVSYASPCTAAADPAIRDGLYDTSSSEGSSLCATLLDHDMHAAFRSLDNSGSPTLLPPMALRRQSTAAPFFPGHSFTDWTTYFTSCNAKVDPFGRFVIPPFVAQPPMQSTAPSHDKRTPRMRKPFACQTKPCRYFVATGKCPSGNKCTFIHDSVPRKSTENSSNTSTNMNARELESKKHDCQSKDFYPITWRVIGGGVMMGGERKICDAFIAGHCEDGEDCKFAHETALETDRELDASVARARPPLLTICPQQTGA